MHPVDGPRAALPILQDFSMRAGYLSLVARITTDRVDASSRMFDISQRTQQSRGIRHGVVLLLASAIACQSELPRSNPGFPSEPVPEPVASVQIVPNGVTLHVGQTRQFVATARDRHGNTVDREITWQSMTADVASITAAGLVQAMNLGSAEIRALSEGVSSTAAVSIIPVPVRAVDVSPDQTTLVVGATQQLLVTTSDSAGAELQGRTVAWTSANASVVSVSGTGLVTALAIGSTYVRASSEGYADSTAISVVAQPPVPIATVEVTPASATLNVNGTQQLTATLRDADGNVLTGRSITWQSLTPSVATVSASGRVTGRAAGSSTVRATSEGVSGEAVITVTAVLPAVATVTVAPATASVNVGATQQLTVTLRDASGNILSGRAVSWQSLSTTVATVSSSGLVTAVAAGTATVRATSEGVTGDATITVTTVAVPIASVTVAPATVNLLVGGTQQLTVTLRDGSGNVLTGRPVSWQSLTPGVASVSSSGLVTGLAGGSATIRATSEGVNGTAAITVTAPVASIVVSPATVNLQVGETLQLSVTLRDAGGNVLTGRSVTWQSLATSIATVSTAGLVSAASAGSVMILASCEGKSDTASVIVTDPPPSTGGIVDPTLLPAATGQRPVAGTYGRSLAAGQTYLDPHTNVRVLKLTSASVPDNNGGQYHGYSEGGPIISQPWVGTDGHTYYTAFIAGGWLVDIRYDTFVSSNWRRVPIDGEINWAFSLNPATPRIAYYVDDGNDRTIHRYNTATNQNENSGIFPYTPRAAGSGLTWLQVNLNDQWLVGMFNGNATVIAVRLSDGLERSYPTSFHGGIDTDEPHIDREFPVVYISTNDEQNVVVNLETNTVVQETDPNFVDAADHAAPLRGKVVAIQYQVPGIVSADRNGTVRIEVTPSPTDWAGDWHMAGQWVFNNPNNYFVIDQWLRDGNFPIRRGMIGFVSLAGDMRVIVAHDATGSGYDTGGQPHPTLSPDGKLLMWTSNMNGSARYDIFVARIPTR
jgi:uncharacterized protein YjdB